MDAQTQQQLGFEVRPAAARAPVVPIVASGQIQLNQDRTWRVGAIVAGKMVEVPVRLGDEVKAGAIVAQMHSHEVHDSRADRRQAIADLDRSKVLADQAMRVRDRTRRLFDLKAASREQMESAETQYQSARLSVSNAEAQVDRTEHHLTEFLDVPLHDNNNDEADRVPVRAPAAGTIIERLANAGTVASSGDPVVVVSDLSSLWLIAAVNEADLSHVRVGQAVRITVRAYPDVVFPGKIFQLGERLDPQTRTLQVRVLVSNPQAKLKPDMFATAEFVSQPGRAGVYVPESAIQELNGRTVVFVRAAAGFAPKEVTAGQRADGQVEIRSGIAAGTPVVVNGALLLKGRLLQSESN